MNARKQSDRDIQKWLQVDLHILALMKMGQLSYIKPLYDLHLKASIKKMRKLLRLT